ncbi:MAG: pantoate--beta-alanine ligase [Campylobacterota bacterium]|nr:pantoate--beta-alanine ligase [Campylobacterota bacterium]
MQILKTIAELKTALNPLSFENKTIGFVPTMGALHDGHISLIKNSRIDNDIVVVSIFINPTQFLANEDLDKYPTKYESDTKICELAKVDYLFMPDINTMYSKDEILLKAPKTKGFILEGEKRPGHFDGMLQIVLKLFNIIQPTNAYFGKKDAQQLVLINQMVKNFFLNINIIQCDIVRENDGLAYSSRNIYLSPLERKEALYISTSLKLAAKLIGTGELDSTNIYNLIYTTLSKSSHIEIEYITIVNQDFESLKTIEIKNSIILIAVKIGNTRLIDNIWI